ncbi:hypothetical protein NADFUDRAFT_81693 [Nadsonia fulvescens var. elongata DSM 6958]|uniref:Vacuolar import and degradation protein n=1 Tax=Nadsonia fulvescens var. elongata DSM 6958 TaxID=857566 RepID=A0A1E3PP52_9ASCO|nr:hypothetical protein NADFUDRAFT_81693 [Nadsonia fulvescens var. elongata DSM 6958]
MPGQGQARDLPNTTTTVTGSTKAVNFKSPHLKNAVYSNEENDGGSQENNDGNNESNEHESDNHLSDTTDDDLVSTSNPFHCISTFLDHPRRPPHGLGSFLRPGSRYIGTQQSGRCTHEVEVEIKTIDPAAAIVSGYLRIQGLTQDHEILTTYFEGEIVSEKYSFFTRHADWGASEKTDLSHWSRFAPFRANQAQMRLKSYVHKDYLSQDQVYMRWKERFFVPDSNITAVEGASYAGFYYICFNQVSGNISGFYYHQRSEKYQQLELSHLPDSGNFYAIEFR